METTVIMVPVEHFLARILEKKENLVERIS
jgi:hypothetical protein